MASPTPGTASPTPTTSPTPAAPTLPAAARADTPTGAESFARHYVELLDYASRTGVVDELEQLGSCGTCRAQARGIRDFFQAGGKVEGGKISVTRVQTVRHVKSAALVNVTYDQAAGRTVTGSGASTQVPARTGEIFTFTLGRSQGAWSVQKLQVVE